MNQLNTMSIMQCLTQSRYLTKSEGMRSLFLGKNHILIPKFTVPLRLLHRSLP